MEEESNVLYATSDPLFTTLVTNQSALDTAKALCANVQESYYDLGCVLYHLKETAEYIQVLPKYNKPNHGGWKDFCNEQLDGISYRTAQYWINLYRYFRDMGISKEDVLKLGWSKAKELIDATDNKEQLDALITYAEMHTVDDVRNHVDGLLDADAGQSHDFRFRLHNAAGEAAKEYLSEIATTTEGDMNAAFFKILVEHKTLVPYFGNEEDAIDLSTIESVI